MNIFRLKSIISILLLAFTISFTITSCDNQGNIDEEELENFLGWLFGDEELEEVEDDVIIDPEPVDSDDLPTSVNMLNIFPPIGNQGKYGTCVSWALGYNLRTALEAQDKGYSPSQLASASRQFSPKYLFWAIPNNLKGADCNGTNFEHAFDVMQSGGVATEQTVPYQSLGNCSSSTQSSWNVEADEHKIDNYREIPELAQNSQVASETKINLLKKYLSQNRPVAFGAKVGDSFMQWNSNDVLSSDTYAYSGQHAYHAMALAGYDDNVGLNGAFSVVNSWNQSWGNNGKIWIDYDFFVDGFCFAAFVASLKASNPSTNSSSGKDLIAWNLLDEEHPESTDPIDRLLTYDVYNIGEEEILASEDWNISYVIYNAYDANDYLILIYDYYSDDFGNYGEDGVLTEEMGDIYGTAGNWWNHINIPSGASVAETLYGEEGVYFAFSYTMPDVSGDFFLVLIADGFDDISEADETNNYFYFTGPDGGPLVFVNGIIQGGAKNLRALQPTDRPHKGSNSPVPTARSKKNLNTYSPYEIQNMIKAHKESGVWQQKVREYMSNNPKAKKNRVKK